MKAIRRHPYTAAIILLAAALAVLAWLFPGSRRIDVTLTVTEYRLDDPDFAVEHSLTLCGRDNRDRLGAGTFQGTISISGLEGMEAPTKILASLGREHSIVSGGFEDPDPLLSVLIPNWDYTELLGLLYTIDTDGTRSTGGPSARFFVSGPADRNAALATASRLAAGTYWEPMFA